MLKLQSFIQFAILATSVIGQTISINGVTILADNPAAVVPNNYIVVMKENTSPDALDQHLASIQAIQAKYGKLSGKKGVRANYNLGGYNAYSGSFDPQTLPAIKNSPDVAYIAADSIQTPALLETNSYIWNLDRISHTQLSSYAGPYNYLYPSNSGSGSTVYVLDTGIDITHPDFEGRASFGYNVFGDNTTDDGVGHGTHCAGIVGSATFGIAKNVNLVAVKVFNNTGYGTTSTVLAGIDWVYSNTANGSNPILSMSLGGVFNQALNDGVNQAMSEGMIMIVAGGNQNVDASTVSPASAAGAISVGASDINDFKAGFSNYGPSLALFAPGVNIPSTIPGNQYAYMSGTSMSAPHIAGIAAIYLSQNGGFMDPTSMRQKIINSATPVAIGNNTMNSPNLVAFMGGEGLSSATTSTSSSTSTTVVYTPSSSSISSVSSSSSSVPSTLAITTTTSASSIVKTTSISSSTAVSTSSKSSSTSAVTTSTSTSISSSSTSSASKSSTIVSGSSSVNPTTSSIASSTSSTLIASTQKPSSSGVVTVSTSTRSSVTSTTPAAVITTSTSSNILISSTKLFTASTAISTTISSSTIKPSTTSSSRSSTLSPPAVTSSPPPTKLTSSTLTKTSSTISPTQTLYGQCGGTDYHGPTICTTGAVCVYQNAYYSQCLAIKTTTVKQSTLSTITLRLVTSTSISSVKKTTTSSTSTVQMRSKGRKTKTVAPASTATVSFNGPAPVRAQETGGGSDDRRRDRGIDSHW